MTNMKPPQEGRNTGAPSLRGLQGRSATGVNGEAAQEEVSAPWRGGWMPENISGVPAGRSVFHLTSPLIGLLARNNFRFARNPGAAMRSRVESRIIPGIAVDAANQKFGPCQRRRAGQLGRPLYYETPCVHLCNRALAVVGYWTPAPPQFRVYVQRDFQHSADSASRGMLARHASTPSPSI